MNNYYTILGLQESATDDQIKQAYRTLAKRYHPDLHPNDEDTAKKFALVNEAMEVLGNPTKRKEYDAKRAAEKRQADATAARAEAVKAAQARAAAARANGGRPGMGGMGGGGMGGGGMYAGSAQGAAAVINDAYRRGYNEATAMFQQQRNVAVDTWKKSADNWKAEADRWKAEAERLRREVDRQRAETEEYMRDVDTLKAALERTRTRAADAEAAARRAETELRVQTGVTEIAKKSVADEAAQRDAIRESYEAKLNAEREARKYSDEDKIRLSREVARLKQEIAELKGEAQAPSHNFDTNDYPPQEAATATPHANTHHTATAGAHSYDIPTYHHAEPVKAKSQFGVGGIDYPDTATHREESYTAEPAKPTVTEDVITKITELSARALGEDDGDAALILGKMYMSGDEVPKKEKDAMLWFKRAAETGNTEAIFNLGLCYVYGNGCDPDFDKGMAFIKEAAAKGCKEATEFLANAQ